MSGKVIYMPKGKAEEYAKWAVNLFTGCSHACHYCYVPPVVHKDRVEFHADVQPRKGILEKLEKEAPNHKGKEVFMCFTCDPYGPEFADTLVTRDAIRILHKHGVGVNILTKGGLRLLRDLDLLKKRPELSKVGATLTFMNTTDSLTWEPHAAMPLQRLEGLWKVHQAGIKTWASLEPVIDPRQTLELIKVSAPYVDHFKVGKWNYDKGACEIDWAKFLREAVELLESLGASYYIKKDLAAFSDKGLE